MKHPFNKRVRRMYKSNVKRRREQIYGVHIYKHGWAEYTDGTVLAREKQEDGLYIDDSVAAATCCPAFCKEPDKYPNTKGLFPQIKGKPKATVYWRKETLLKVLDLFGKDDAIQFDIREGSLPTFFRNRNGSIHGLIMGCSR